MKQRGPQRDMHLHSVGCSKSEFFIKNVQCALCALTAFGHEEQMKPHGYVCSRQDDADSTISARRKGPFQCYTDVVQFSNIRGHAFGNGSQRHYGRGKRDEVPKELRMTSRDLFS